MTKLTETERKFCGKGYRNIVVQLYKRYQLKKGRKEMRKAMDTPWDVEEQGFVSDWLC